MDFDINNYEGNFVIHCKTQEEAQNFCAYLHSVDRIWVDGNPYVVDNTNWYIYRENTVYHFNDGTYGTYKYAQDNGYTILEWEDFMSRREEMKIYQVYLDAHYTDPDCNDVWERTYEAFFQNKQNAIEHMHKMAEDEQINDELKVNGYYEVEKDYEEPDVQEEYARSHSQSNALEVIKTYYGNRWVVREINVQ